MMPDKLNYSPTDPLQFETVEIYGLPHLPKAVHVDGAAYSQQNIRYFDKVVTPVGDDGDLAFALATSYPVFFLPFSCTS